ncbi:MAG TPA: hypothetical protein VI338_03630 [Nitrososphaera sp.]|nr:hypothetical protein [Nitrososphaera sp.]
MFEILIKSGGVVSTAGVGLFIAFVTVLLVFPVIKSCDSSNTNCEYSSTAPEPFRSIVQPAYLAASLLVIAGGVFLVRFGRWRDSKKTGEGV